MVSPVGNTTNYNYKEAKGGGFSAMVQASTIPFALSPASLLIINKMKKINNFSETEVSQIKNATQQILEKKGLLDKLVNVEYIPEVEVLKDFKSKLLDRIMTINNPLESVARGENAFFTPKVITLSKSDGFETFWGNTIIMPENKIQGAVFHELGHAHNYNYGKALKLLQKIRPASIVLPAVLLLYGAFTKKSKPTQENPELSKKQKVNNFIRDNAGILAFISTIPMLIEEAAATIKGKKFAKEFLSGEIAKRATKGNLVAYLSYLLTAVTAAIAAHAAVKIKDKKIEKKERELQMALNINA